MTVTGIKLGWGEDVEGIMRHINDVANGLKCGCVCPDCYTELVARQGSNAWHFAHHKTVDCAGESALHLAAKQILESAAYEKASICTPKIEGTLSHKDISGLSHVTEWKIDVCPHAMESAEQEVPLLPNLRSDVLIMRSSEKPIAVEIHVTNAKDDDDKAKYEAWGKDAIEIDLSKMPWDSDEVAIRDAVLRDAPRQWLFSAEACELADTRERDLLSDIASVNFELMERLRTVVIKYQRKGNLDDLHYNWPTLERHVSGEYNGKTLTGSAVTSPRITELSASWGRVEGGWKTEGIVNKKSVADIYFLLDGVSRARLGSKRPTLVLVYAHTILKASGEANPTYIFWMGVQKWKDKLERLAKDNLQDIVEAEKKKNSGIDRFALDFHAMNNKEQLNFLAKRMGQTAPDWLGKHVTAWNTTYNIWKTLVWIYHIKKYEGIRDYIVVRDVARNEWLQKLLQWPEHKGAVDQRARNLWFWFKELESSGFLKHDGRQCFIVKVGLPQDFKPWDKVKS